MTRDDGKAKGAGDDDSEERAEAEAMRGLTGIVRGARLEPIRYVERELTRPDGSKLVVKVPVYPPFRLEDRPSPKAAPEPQKRLPARRKAS